MSEMNTVKPIYPGAFPLPSEEEDAAPRYPTAPLNLTLGFDLETYQDRKSVV